MTSMHELPHLGFRELLSKAALSHEQCLTLDAGSHGLSIRQNGLGWPWMRSPPPCTQHITLCEPPSCSGYTLSAISGVRFYSGAGRQKSGANNPNQVANDVGDVDAAKDLAAAILMGRVSTPGSRSYSIVMRLVSTRLLSDCYVCGSLS